MNNKMIMTTGNVVVDFIGKLNFTGNIIPEAWYRTVVNEKGKTNNLALMILSDIVYWYRPTEQRDERTNRVVYKKKFRADILQRSYVQICDKFNCSQRQARDAIIFLEKTGVIKREFRTIDVLEGRLSNVMFIALDPEVLYKLTFPAAYDNDHEAGDPINRTDEQGASLATEIELNEEDSTLLTNLQIPPSDNDTLLTNLQRGVDKNVNTYTKNTTKNTKDILTTTSILKSSGNNLGDSVVEQAQKIFSGINITFENLHAIVKASNYNLEKCEKAVRVYQKQTKTIHNIVGWFIEAVKKNYELVESEPSKINRHMNFNQRDYDWDKLESVLVGV